MKINKINDINFGMRFKLSDETLRLISESTKLSVDELHNLPMAESERLMKERGSLKEPNKFKEWLISLYKSFGEKTGLLKKQRVIYTHDKIIYM